MEDIFTKLPLSIKLAATKPGWINDPTLGLDRSKILAAAIGYDKTFVSSDTELGKTEAEFNANDNLKAKIPGGIRYRVEYMEYFFAPNAIEPTEVWVRAVAHKV